MGESEGRRRRGGREEGGKERAQRRKMSFTRVIKIISGHKLHKKV